MKNFRHFCAHLTHFLWCGYDLATLQCVLVFRAYPHPTRLILIPNNSWTIDQTGHNVTFIV